MKVISARVVVGREVGSLPTLRLLYEPEGLDSEGGILRQNSRYLKINHYSFRRQADNMERKEKERKY